jgi:hypothetical protein
VVRARPERLVANFSRGYVHGIPSRVKTELHINYASVDFHLQRAAQDDGSAARNLLGDALDVHS